MAIKSISFGFIGLGNMGSEMARNLSSFAKENACPPVKIWNRTQQKSESVCNGSHAEIAVDVQAVVQGSDIIHMCLANDGVAIDIVEQIMAVGKPGLILVDHSTLFPKTSHILQTKTAQQGIIFCSCPVFGPPAAAKSATLLVVLSGNDEARETLKTYVAPAIGKAVIDCGSDSSKGAMLKVLGNNCILGTIELLSESFILAEKTEFDLGLFYQFIEAWFPAPAWVNYGKKIRDGSFSGATGFTIAGGMKDAGFIRRLGVESATPTPIIDQAWAHLNMAKLAGGQSLDWSACAAGMRMTAGLKPFKGEDFSISSNTFNGEKREGL